MKIEPIRLLAFALLFTGILSGAALAVPAPDSEPGHLPLPGLTGTEVIRIENAEEIEIVFKGDPDRIRRRYARDTTRWSVENDRLILPEATGDWPETEVLQVRARPERNLGAAVLLGVPVGLVLGALGLAVFPEEPDGEFFDADRLRFLGATTFVAGPVIVYFLSGTWKTAYRSERTGLFRTNGRNRTPPHSRSAMLSPAGP
ncbi:MAG: hypothetical protein GF346_08615 [Candidatus Eisenbacteria bacterium]|nr:hypothetical protein [Candidatus Latescibacterota bacterium]MBD3302497.1 hypothetical protein [Candidatus Eisenbacteria bacterium]